MASSEQVLRIFVSSPMDVLPERDRVDRVIRRLNAALGNVRLESVRWETDFYTADSTFQAQIVDPGACQMVVTIFWQRLGKELPPDFERMPDGRLYPSGTVYELARALKARHESGGKIPDVIVYRKTADVSVSMTDEHRYRLAHEQREAFLRFWEEWFESKEGHFKAAYNSFAATDQFERDFEAHLRAWLKESGYLASTVTWPLAEKGSPFRGLEPFDVEHEEVFFGRSRDIDRALARLARAAERGVRFLLLVGESGSGKSSLARAGLAPRICRGAFEGEPESWRRAVLRLNATEKPLLTFANALFDERALPELAQGDLSTPQVFAAVMAESSKAAVQSIARTLERVEAELQRRLSSDETNRVRIILLVDQLEELLTTSADQGAVERLVAILRDLAGLGNVVVIATLRSDSYAALSRFPPLFALKDAGETLDVATPDAAAIAEIVRAPAAAAGLSFGQDERSGQTLDDVIINAAGGHDALPLLQFTLSRLYQEMERRLARLGETVATAKPDELVLAVEDYARFGGLEGAIGEEAEHAVSGLGHEAQGELPRLLRALVDIEPGGATQAASVRLRDVPWGDAAPNAAADVLVDALVTARILVASGSSTDRDRRLRLAHEAVLRTWPRAATIVGEHKEFFRIRSDVLSAHRRWEGGARNRDLLIPRGVPLAEAESIVGSFGPELTPDTRAFVAASGRRARRRQRLLIGGSIAAAVVFAVLAGMAYLARARADEATLQATARLAASDFREATVRLDADRPTEALAFLARAIRGAPTVSARALALSILAAVNWPIEILEHDGPVSAAQFGPNGAYVLTVAASTLQIWDVRTGLPASGPLRHDDEIVSAIFSPDGRQIVTASADGTARLWDVRTGQHAYTLRHDDDVWSATFNPDGTRVVTASVDHTARIWDARTGEPVGEILQHDHIVSNAAFSPDGSRLVTVCRDNKVRIWDVKSRRILGTPIQQEAVNWAAFGPDGSSLLTTTENGVARLWNTETGEALGAALRHDAAIWSAAFSPDGLRVVTASDDGTARLWDLQTGKLVGSPLEHNDGVRMATFSPDGTRLLTASDDKTSRVWDANSGEALGPPLWHGEAVTAAMFIGSATSILTAARDNTARLWHVHAYRAGARLPYNAPVRVAQFSPDGTLILTSSDDGTARLWHSRTFRPVGSPLQHKDRVEGAAFSPDGSRVVTASFDNTARVWNARTGAPEGPALTHEDLVRSAIFSPDGRLVLTASADGTARVWDARTGKPEGAALRHSDQVATALFSPDGGRVVTSSWDGTAQIWNWRTGQAVGAPLRHGDTVVGAMFSPNGMRILTASMDGTARFWDARTSKPLGTPMRHESWVNSATFSPDGKRVVTTSVDGTARIWDTGTGEPVGMPLQHGGSVLTANFSQDGARVVTTSTDGNARVWDVLTGQAAGIPFQHQDVVWTARFSPDGLRVVTSSRDSVVQVWDALTGTATDAADIANLAEVIAGVRVNDEGAVLPLATRSRHLKNLRERAMNLAAEGSPFAPVMLWFFEDAWSRTISPLSSVTVPEYIKQLLSHGNDASRREAQRTFPGHPLLRGSATPGSSRN